MMMKLDHPGEVLAMYAFDGYFPIPGYRYLVPRRMPALFTACEDGRVRMWPVEHYGTKPNRQSCKFLREFGGPAYGKVLSLIAADIPGEWANIPSLFTGCEDHLIRHYHLKGGSCVRMFSGHTGTVRCLSVHKRRLFSGSEDRSVRVWDIRRGTCLHTLVGHEDVVTAVCMSCAWLFSASMDGTVRQWDATTGAQMAVIRIGAGPALSLCSDGSVLFVGMEDGTCHRYNIPQLLVDCKVEVWWGGDARWHPGVLHSYREHSKKYELVYEDGDTEDLALPNIELRLATGLDPRRGPRGEQETPGVPRVGRSKRLGPAASQARSHIGGYYDDDDMGPGGGEELSTVKSIVSDPDLPPGWTVEERKRTNAHAKTVKRVDKYYIAPGGRTFRSKLEVMRHLESEAGLATPSSTGGGQKRSAEASFDEQPRKVPRLGRPRAEGGEREWGAVSPTASPSAAALTPSTMASFEQLGSMLINNDTNPSASGSLKIKVDDQEKNPKDSKDSKDAMPERTPTLSGRQPKTPSHLRDSE